MKLWVVTDAMGAGRVIGVFDSQALAERIARADPAYCAVHPCELNLPDDEALAWAQSEGRSALATVLEALSVVTNRSKK